MGQRSMIEHQGITHVDNTHWRRGSERRMSSPPKGGSEGKSTSKNVLLSRGLCRLQGRPKAEDSHGPIDEEIGVSRKSWKGYLIQSSLVASRGGCVVCHPNLICTAPSRLPFLWHLSVLHTQRFLPAPPIARPWWFSAVQRIPEALPRHPHDSCPPRGL